MGKAEYKPIDFSDIDGWADDDLGQALLPFANVAAALAIDCAGATDDTVLIALAKLSRRAGELVAQKAPQLARRAFFEEHFIAYQVVHTGGDGLLTGYYEPELLAARERTDRFKVPLYRRPDDLVNIVGDDMRGAVGEQYTHARQTENGIAPYATRSQIEQGALVGLGLEFLYLEDAVETFFLHVQGSGLVVLPDGSRVRIGYDGKNGHPYTSVGRFVADKGWLDRQSVTLEALKTWLQADVERGRKALWQNDSFIFFKELGPADEAAACGVKDIPLTPGRSLALDPGFHRIGAPVFVSAPTIDFADDVPGPFKRLMVAQDVGSAITGAERGDIYYGSGDRAGHLAGITKHRGNFFILLPKEAAI